MRVTVGIDDTGAKAGAIKVGVSRGGKLSELDKRIYRAAARAALKTGRSNHYSFMRRC